MRDAEPVRALPSAIENRGANVSRVDDKERGTPRVAPALFLRDGSRSAVVVPTLVRSDGGSCACRLKRQGTGGCCRVDGRRPGARIGVWRRWWARWGRYPAGEGSSRRRGDGIPWCGHLQRRHRAARRAGREPMNPLKSGILRAAGARRGLGERQRGERRRRDGRGLFTRGIVYLRYNSEQNV